MGVYMLKVCLLHLHGCLKVKDLIHWQTLETSVFSTKNNNNGNKIPSTSSMCYGTETNFVYSIYAMIARDDS